MQRDEHAAEAGADHGDAASIEVGALLGHRLGARRVRLAGKH